MARLDLDQNFRKIDDLISEINRKFPPDDAYDIVQLRADLAGLLVVAMAATYETCVKETICNYATGRHDDFGRFAVRNYERLNSRIQVNDLYNYCRLFGPNIKDKFKTKLDARRKKISERTGKNIESSFRQILDWRHDFAHAWNRSTTIEEAEKTHRFAKRVLYAFDEAFSESTITSAREPLEVS